jgi:hypothetical protein
MVTGYVPAYVTAYAADHICIGTGVRSDITENSVAVAQGFASPLDPRPDSIISNVL